MAIKLDKSKLARTLVSRQKLVPHLERAVDGGDFAWTAKFRVKKDDDAFHPSSDCLTSLQELYMMAKGVLPPWTPGTSLRKSFVVGTFWHEYIQTLVVKKLGFAEAKHIERSGETRWGEGPYRWARGSGDIAPVSLPVHGNYLVDIKTMKAYDFKGKGLPGWAQQKYIAQINLYMDWFDLERALILCIEKDSPHAFREVEIARNQPLIDAIYRKWKLVGACLDENVEPPAEEVIDLPFSEKDIRNG